MLNCGMTKQLNAKPTFTAPRRGISAGGEDGVVDGTRTRNIQNHNLGLYH